MRVLILLLFFASSIFAQDFDAYQLLQNEGDLPEDFITSSAVKYEKEIEALDKRLKRKDKKDQEQFFLESNYTIDDLLLSGQVFYNNEVTRYVNKVADKILKDDPVFRKQLRIYVVRSSSVNAFATNQGIILVNMGLLAQLENEAQLAYILCHEMIHVKHAHALDMFLEAKNIDRYTDQQQLFKKTNYSDVLVAKNHYSKELETEADDKGLDLYLKTDYSLEALDGVFDVLQYSYLPFDEVVFDQTFFNNEFITIPTNFFMEATELNPIEVTEEEDASKSTHPSVYTRRASIKNRVGGIKNGTKKEFLLPKSAFDKVQKMARYELVYYHLRNFRLQDAIYATYLLMRTDPNSKYLKMSLAKALFTFAKLKDVYNSKSMEMEEARSIFGKKAHKGIQGQSQQVYYMFTKIEVKELKVLALRYLWDLKKEYPENKELNRMLKDMFDELIEDYKELSEFSSQSQAAIAKDTVSTVEKQDTSEKLSKYDKIKKQKKKEIIENPDFGTYAFWDVINDAEFREEFAAAKKREEQNTKTQDYYSSTEGRKYLKKKNKKGASLGIDSVLAINPYYLRLDARKKDVKVKYVHSEDNQLKLRERMQKSADLAKVNLEMLDADNLNAEQSADFNEIVVIKDWLSQQYNLTGYLMPSLNQGAMEKLMAKHGTRYLMLSGVISIHTKKPGGLIAASVLYTLGSAGLFLPYTIYLLAKPNFEMLYYAILYDTKTQRYEVLKYDYFRRKDSRSVINAHMYDAFNQIKRTNKKSK